MSRQWNVRDSDGTVVFTLASEATGGSLKTIKFADKHRKPVLYLSSGRYHAPLSQHMEFRALDIAFDGVSPQRVYDRLLEWRKAGKFTGGLGLYPSSGFVHIDTRGGNATWGAS